MGTAPRPQAARAQGSGRPKSDPKLDPKSDKDEHQKHEKLDRVQVHQALYVAGAGAIGGLLFWMLSKYAGTATFAAWKWYGQILALMFLGSMAGLFGVYLLTSSSLNSIRTYIFAIVCGVVWQPIINSAMQSVVNATATKNVAEVSSQTAQLKITADHGSVQDVTLSVNATVPAVTQAIQQLPDVQDAAKKQEIVDSSQNAIGALETAANKAPDSSIDGIRQVGVAAGQGNHTSVSLRAVQSLRTIGLSATSNNRPEVEKLTVESLKAISDHTSDPTVKSAVAATLSDLATAGTKPIDQPPRHSVPPR